MQRATTTPQPLAFLLSLAMGSLASVGCEVERSGTWPPRLDGGRGAPTGTGGVSRWESDERRSGAPWLPPESDASLRDGEAPPDGGAAPGGAGSCPRDDALVSCHRFEDDLSDGAGRGLDAMGTNITYADGRVGRAAVLKEDSGLWIEGTEALDLERFTIALWFQLDRTPGSGRRFGLVDKQGQYGMFVYSDGRLACSASDERTFSDRSTISADGWVHAACTFDGRQLRAYVDGSPAASEDADDDVDEGDGYALHIGENSPDGEDQLIGRIDELHVWSRALGADAIADAGAR